MNTLEKQKKYYQSFRGYRKGYCPLLGCKNKSIGENRLLCHECEERKRNYLHIKALEKRIQELTVALESKA